MTAPSSEALAKARSAAIEFGDIFYNEDDRVLMSLGKLAFALEQARAASAAEEREACAALCENGANDANAAKMLLGNDQAAHIIGEHRKGVLLKAAQLIRARGDASPSD